MFASRRAKYEGVNNPVNEFRGCSGDGDAADRGIVIPGGGDLLWGGDGDAAIDELEDEWVKVRDRSVGVGGV